MTYSVYDESPLSAAARLVAAELRKDTSLLAFFEGRILDMSTEELHGPIKTPTLAVAPRTPIQERQIGGAMDAGLGVVAFALLSRLTAGRSNLTTPASPSAAAGATGPLTGSYAYRLTQFGPLGESWATAASTAISVTNKAITVTLPSLASGYYGFRLWRTTATGLAYRHRATIWAPTGTWTDTGLDAALGDELAPIRGFELNLLTEFQRIILTSEWLQETSVYRSEAIVSAAMGGSRLITDRNFLAIPIAFDVTVSYDPKTKLPTIGDV